MSALENIYQHVLSELARHRENHSSSRTPIPPLVVGVQGPQGSGKTFLTSQLKTRLAPTIQTAVLSADDLYLPHAALVELAHSNPESLLLKGRGQPGTHDVALGTHILSSLRAINSPGSAPVSIPIFEKSLHNGEGDRAGEIVSEGPLDVVIMEGWFLGFGPISSEELQHRYRLPVRGLPPDVFSLSSFREDDIANINEHLKAYEVWWSFFDTFVQLSPSNEDAPYSVIYDWRLQQERAMKLANGGRGMSDDQVKRFVDRYIPGYVFFGDAAARRYHGHTMRIEIDEHRDVVRVLSL